MPKLVKPPFWIADEDPAGLWWEPWDFINSRPLLGTSVAYVGLMVTYPPTIEHKLLHGKRMVSVGKRSTFIAILYLLYLKSEVHCPMFKGVIWLSPRLATDNKRLFQLRPRGQRSKLQFANVQAEGCSHGRFILHNHLAFGEGHLGAGLRLLTKRHRTCSVFLPGPTTPLEDFMKVWPLDKITCQSCIKAVWCT